MIDYAETTRTDMDRDELERVLARERAVYRRRQELRGPSRPEQEARRAA